MADSSPKIYKYNNWASWGLFISLLWGLGVFSLIGTLMGLFGYLRLRKRRDIEKGFLRAYMAMFMGVTGVLITLFHLSAIREMMAL